MFGHGAFDSPLKTFNASPYCSQDSNKNAPEKVIGCPPWRGDYYANFVEGVEPDWNSTWDEDAEIDRQFDLDTQKWQAKEKQLEDFIEIMFQAGGYGPNHELRWCHNEKYGTNLNWWLYDKNDTSTHVAKNSIEASALSHSEVKGMMEEIKKLLNKTDETGTSTVKEVDCADEGMEENESFNYGPSNSNNQSGSGNGNGGGGGSSNTAESKPLFCWKCPAGYILGGLGMLGAGYIYFMIKHPGYFVAGQAIGTGGNLLGKMLGK